MSTKTMKILTFIATLLIVIAMCSNVVFAASKLDPNDVVGKMENSSGNANTNQITNLGGNILNILQIVGIVVGAIILVVLGLKYMMGSLEEKAEYKKSMIPLIVGIVVVMGATTIANLLVNTFTTSA